MKFTILEFLVASLFILAVKAEELATKEVEQKPATEQQPMAEPQASLDYGKEEEAEAKRSMLYLFQQMIDVGATSYDASRESKDVFALRDEAINVLDQFIKNPNEEQLEAQKHNPALVDAAKLAYDELMLDKTASADSKA
ncbi:uncharacterized protein LOC116349631 [Contarinia nasturtii]|uniref:uncharacterized protein LOC116349631 n=1 Tax=Contarinia nasturtii TaxID=265458 RepID=UPI0012D449C5|nr:uncharacterized protein LOC116349631 [Contarinia nasturtii]